MRQLFVMLATSNAGPVILIIALLLVAGVIGYLTAWFYAKSIYTPVIKKLETEKADLLNQVAILKGDIVKANLKADKLTERIGTLEKEISARDKELKELKELNELNELKKPVKQ